MRFKWLFLLLIPVIQGCANNGVEAEANNGAVCFSGEFNAPWNASGRVNGVRLDADIDVTQVSVEQWIQLYEAICPAAGN